MSSTTPVIRKRAQKRPSAAAGGGAPKTNPIQAVKDEAADLKARLIAATTVAEFQACADIADKSLYEKAFYIDWNDDMACFFITDTRNWTTEAIKWLSWMEANPTLAPHAGEWRQRPDKRGVYKVGPPDIITENLEDARKAAIQALDAFLN